MTHLVDIRLIKDAANVVLAHREQPIFTFGTAYFKGPSILEKLVKRLELTINIDMGDQRVEPMTTTGEGSIGISAPALTCTLAPATTTSPPHPTAVDIIRVPSEFVQRMIKQ